MSVPMSHEDLQKLHAFIDFVSANPTILNQPSLDFVKKFIEKFGGKVPEGEYKIPAGGKCPFGGDAGEKKEPATEEPVSEDSESEEAEMDFEPESELELDMDAISEDEPETVMTRKRRAPKRKATALKIKVNTTKRTKRRKLKKIVKNEEPSDIECNEIDPLFIKHEFIDTDSTKNLRSKPMLQKSLDKSGKRLKRPRKLICFETCKYKCSQNFTANQRKILCSEYWLMDEDAKIAYLENSIALHKTRRVCQQKTDRPRREFMCRYFMQASDGQKHSVCSVFFTATLALKSYILKKILATIWERRKNIKSDPSMYDTLPDESMVSVIIEKAENSSSENITQIDNTDYSTANELQIEDTPKATTERRKIDLSRTLRPANCEEINCRFSCTSKISEAHREKLCSGFWALDFKRRKDYLISHVQSHAIITKTVAEFLKSNRPRSHQNHFFLRNEKGENVRVCSRFFTATLSLGSNYISRTLRRSDPTTGTYIGDDMRGRKEPYNKTKPELREEVKRHIESYPVWTPNKRSKTKYLHSSLTVQKMFNDYKQKCIANNRKFVNSSYFRKVFREDFRLAFLRPSSQNAQKVGTAKRNSAQSTSKKSANKIKKVKAPNAFLSEYTGEEGGYWSTTADVVDLGSPIKEITVTTTIDRAEVIPAEQNIIYTADPSGASTGLIRYTNYAGAQSIVQDVHVLQTVNNQTEYIQQQHQQQQELQLQHAEQQEHQLLEAHYDEQTHEVYHMV